MLKHHLLLIDLAALSPFPVVEYTCEALSERYRARYLERLLTISLFIRRLDLIYGEQSQIEAVYFEQQTEQFGLVAHRPGEEGFAVGFITDHQRLEPLPPFFSQMFFDTDLVNSWDRHCQVAVLA
jgi:hypothetical protein